MRMNSGFYIHRILDLFIKITGIKKHKKKRQKKKNTCLSGRDDGDYSLHIDYNCGQIGLQAHGNQAH